MFACGNGRLWAVLSMSALLVYGCSRPAPAVNPTDEAAIQDFVASDDLPTATKQLVKLGEVQSEGIYDSGIASPFGKLKKVFLAKGKSGYFRKMLRADEVIVRAMGMSCLAESDGAKAIPDLRPRLWSRMRLRRQEGCIGDIITEGAYARQLLMGVCPPDSRWALDLEILSRNDAAAMHEDAANGIETGESKDGSAETKPALPADWDALKKYRGTLTDAQIVKALGRLEPNGAVEAFLITCVGDTKLDALTRLTAASALTRYCDDKAGEAVRSHREEFDRLEKDAGTIIWDTFQTRKRFEDAMAPIRAEKTEQIENKVLAVLRDFKHPLALREIYGMRDLALMHDHPEVAEVQRQAFLRIIEELPSNEQPWNTYGSEAYYMDFMLRDPNESEDLTAKPAGSSYIKGLGTGSVTTQEQDRHRRILHAMSTAIQADQKQRLKEEGR